jgi:hypothetical protein
LSPVVWHPDPALWESTFIATKLRIERARARLDVLLALDTDWDPDGAAPPNRRAGAIVSNILDELEKEALPPTAILPSMEGGIGLTFIEGAKRAYIEVFNTEEITAILDSEENEPSALDIDTSARSIRAATGRIRVHLAS